MFANGTEHSVFKLDLYHIDSFFFLLNVSNLNYFFAPQNLARTDKSNVLQINDTKMHPIDLLHVCWKMSHIFINA